MGQDWIIDVLTDLRAFAQANELPRLASQLDQTMAVALSEVARQPNPHKNRSELGDTIRQRKHA